MDAAVGIIAVSLAAFLLPLVASRLLLPAVVLEILFGILAGPSGLHLIEESELLEQLAEMGFLLLMFLSGFEIDFGQLERQGIGQIATGLAVFVLTLGFAYLAADFLGHGPFLTLVLATTSVGLVVPTLRGARQMATPLGQAILISALMADLLTLIGVTLFAMVREHGLGWKLINFPILFICIAILLLTLRRLAWWFPDKFERLFEPEDPEEMGIRTCLALMFVFAGLSYLLGVEIILGAFLAGTVFAMVFRHREHLENKLKGFSYGFLIPIFFIHVGLSFDVASLRQPGVLLGALALLASAVLVKVLAAGVLVFRRFSLRSSLAAGMLLSSRLSLVIAVAALGTRIGILDRSLEAQVILLAIVTATVCPTLFRALAPPAVAVREDARPVSAA